MKFESLAFSLDSLLSVQKEKALATERFRCKGVVIIYSKFLLFLILITEYTANAMYTMSAINMKMLAKNSMPTANHKSETTACAINDMIIPFFALLLKFKKSKPRESANITQITIIK